eukprot:2174742-Lingulodinium_polyedra.AAC.1
MKVALKHYGKRDVACAGYREQREERMMLLAERRRLREDLGKTEGNAEAEAAVQKKLGELTRKMKRVRRQRKEERKAGLL